MLYLFLCSYARSAVSAVSVYMSAVSVPLASFSLCSTRLCFWENMMIVIVSYYIGYRLLWLLYAMDSMMAIGLCVLANFILENRLVSICGVYIRYANRKFSIIDLGRDTIELSKTGDKQPVFT